MSEPRPDPRTEVLLANADWVRRLARRLLRDAFLAEDVAQDVWAAYLEHPPRRFRDPGGVRAWLRRVTRNLARREGIPSATVRKRIQRGLERLRARLARRHGERGDGLHPGPLGLLRAAAGGVAGPGRVARRRLLGESPIPLETDRNLGIVVRDPRGRPVEGARVLVFAGDAHAPPDTTDGRGRVLFADPDLPAGGGGAMVLDWGGPPQSFELASLRGEQALRLRAGATLAGGLRVDGEAPGEEVELRISFPSDGTAAELPDAAREALGEALEGPLEIRTEPDGAFAVEGLPRGWAGEILLPEHLWYREAPPQGEILPELALALREARTDLALETTRLPSIRGQVVLKETGEPVAGAHVALVADFADGEQTPMLDDLTEDHGRFDIPLFPSHQSAHASWKHVETRADLLSANLWISHPHAGKGIGRSISPGEIDANGEIGRIELPRPQALRFRVADPEGHPITRAGPDDVLDVVLRPSNRLTIRLTGPGDGPPDGVRLDLDSERPILGDPGTSTLTPLLFALWSRTVTSWSGGTKGFTVRLMPDAEGRVLAEERVAGLGEEEALEVELRVEGEPIALAGRVIDPGGRPVLGANVELRLDGERRFLAQAKTDASGIYTFRPLYVDGGLATLTARRRGYVPARRRVLLRRGMEGPTLELAPGRSILVRLRDEEGRDLPAHSVSTQLGELGSIRSQRLEPALHRLEGLPPTSLVLSTRIGGRTYELEVGAADPEVLWILPVHGFVTLGLAGVGPQEGFLQALVESVEEPDVRAAVELIETEGEWTSQRAPLLPGSYRVRIEDEPGASVPAVEFRITAGEDVAVALVGGG